MYPLLNRKMISYADLRILITPDKDDVVFKILKKFQFSCCIYE